MASESFPIQGKGFPKAPLEKSQRNLAIPDQEEQLCIEVLSKQTKGSSQPLALRKIKQITKDGLAVMQDAKWMGLIVNNFTIIARVCTLIGQSTGQVVPYLNIATTPFYLYPTIKSSSDRFKLFKSAIKSSQITEGFFWAGRGFGSVGLAIGNLIKPFAGGAQIAGWHSIPAVSTFFILVIPVLLIVLSAIGGAIEMWATERNARAYKDFEQKTSKVNENLEELDQLLNELCGPQPGAYGEQMDKYTLDLKYFNETHFTNDMRRERIQSRIETLLDQPQRRAKILNEMKKLQGLMGEVHLLSEELMDPLSSDFKNLDTLIELYDKLLPTEDENLKTVIGESLKELQGLKENLLQEGKEILSATKSEMHRILLQNAVMLLIVVLGLTAGILFLLPPPCPIAASILVIASAVFASANILFDKTVSQERFLALGRYLRTISDFNSTQPVE